MASCWAAAAFTAAGGGVMYSMKWPTAGCSWAGLCWCWRPCLCGGAISFVRQSIRDIIHQLFRSVCVMDDAVYRIRGDVCCVLLGIFDRALYPNDGVWPPEGIATFDPFDLPLINTLVLLLSGCTVTWARRTATWQPSRFYDRAWHHNFAWHVVYRFTGLDIAMRHWLY